MRAMRVVVLGSTGLLGRTIVADLAGRGHAVAGISRRGLPCREAPRAEATVLDVVTAGDAELEATFAGADAVVHCLGPDDRDRVRGSATDYFQRLLVTPTARVAAAARRAGVGSLVVLGSYFTAFDRLHPEWDLPRRHPYIQARVDQARRSREAGPDATSVLEIPFVFGALTGIVPMWKSYLIDPTRRSPGAGAPAGSSAAVSNTDVALAVAALIEGRCAPGAYPVSTDVYPYARLVRVICDALGQTRKKVVTVPTPLLGAGLRAEGWRLAVVGKSSGLTPRLLAPDMLARDLGLDPAAYAPALGLTPRNLDDVVRATVAACRG